MRHIHWCTSIIIINTIYMVSVKPGKFMPCTHDSLIPRYAYTLQNIIIIMISQWCVISSNLYVWWVVADWTSVCLRMTHIHLMHFIIHSLFVFLVCLCMLLAPQDVFSDEKVMECSAFLVSEGGF